MNRKYNTGQINMSEALFAMSVAEDAKRDRSLSNKEYRPRRPRRAAARLSARGCMSWMLGTFAVWMLFTTVVSIVV